MAAALATSGRRAHQTWRKLNGGSALAAALSRLLSIPNSATGSHSSINTGGRSVRFTPRPAKHEAPAERVGRPAQHTLHTSSTPPR